jgi:hypothetical protein
VHVYQFYHTCFFSVCRWQVTSAGAETSSRDTLAWPRAQFVCPAACFESSQLEQHVVALSLGGLRRRMEAALMPEKVDVKPRARPPCLSAGACAGRDCPMVKLRAAFPELAGLTPAPLVPLPGRRVHSGPLVRCVARHYHPAVFIRMLPAGLIAPCLPTKASTPPQASCGCMRSSTAASVREAFVA